MVDFSLRTRSSTEPTILDPRTRRVACLTLAGLALAAAACRGPQPLAPRSPNLIIVSADTLNRAALRAFEPAAPVHPALDRFAEHSVVFTRAVTPAPWTLPAHASLFTGRYPNRHGALRVQQTLAPEVPTLAETLRAAGYATVAFTDGALLDPEFGHSRGFQLYDERRLDPDFTLRGTLPRDGAPDLDHGRSIFDRAIAWLGLRDPGDPPFLLFLHSFAVHDYFLLYGDAVPAPPVAGNWPAHLDCLVGDAQCSAEQWQYLGRRYAAGVRVFDAAFGRLLSALAERGLEDDTVLVLLADHGEGFDPARGRIHHAGRVHGDLIRIPLLVRGPGLEPRSTGVPVSLIDLLPTLLDLAGVPVPPGIDGRSLRHELRHAAPDGERILYAMEYAYYWRGGRRHYHPRAEPFSIAAIHGDTWYLKSDDGEALYRVDADPDQRIDLASSDADLEALRAAAQAAALWTGPASEPPLIDEALEEHLRALGYVR